MHIHTPGRTTTLREINPGTLFLAKARVDMGLYLAVEPQRDQGPPDAVALIPGHPMLSGNPGLLSSRIFGDYTIFSLDNAAIIFDVNLLNITTNHQKHPDNRRVIYSIGGKFYVHFNSDSYQTSTVNIETGLYEEADLYRAAIILAWRVVWTDASGITHEIARQDCRSGEAA